MILMIPSNVFKCTYNPPSSENRIGQEYLTATAPEDAREAFPELIKITTIGTFTLNTEFKAAIKRIDDDAEAYARNHNHRSAPHNAQHRT